MDNQSFVNVNVFDLFLVLFVGLKLAGIIDWSWWWVMSPLFALPAIYLISFIFGFITTVIINLFSKQE